MWAPQFIVARSLRQSCFQSSANAASFSALSGNSPAIIQQQNFLVEQDHVSIRQNAFIDHRPIAVIGLAAEDDALIGFGWGHRDAA
jgi:hypothetical protein